MDYDDFLQQVSGDLGLAWRKYRRRNARRAVLARMEELGLRDLSDYLRAVRADPEEARALPDRMRVTVTRFLRERDRWEDLFARVVPELATGRAVFRVWSAGCCGGEEPYSFSLLWLDRCAARLPGTALRLLATDIDPPSLRRAEEGIYGAASLREVPDALRERGFAREGRAWRVREAVRAPVTFSRHNLLEDPPPAGTDLALCRYLAFTYYRGERRARAVRRLHGSLRPGGGLAIGRKEGLSPPDLELFEPWPGVPGVFRRREGAPAASG